LPYEFVVKAKDHSVSENGVLLPTFISVAHHQILTVSVPADQLWGCAEGQTYTSNANGLSNLGAWSHNGLTAFVGSLVGSLDGGTSFFGIGTRLEMSILIPGGDLHLGYWDSDSDNNHGSVTATVAVYSGPQ
jgi:hypothetical protein